MLYVGWLAALTGSNISFFSFFFRGMNNKIGECKAPVKKKKSV